MLSPTFRNSPTSTSNFMVNEDESIPSPAQQLRKAQSATRNSPADSHRSAFSNRTQTGLIENDDIKDTDVFINGVPVENGDSALGADAALGADVAALGADGHDWWYCDDGEWEQVGGGVRCAEAAGW